MKPLDNKGKTNPAAEKLPSGTFFRVAHGPVVVKSSDNIKGPQNKPLPLKSILPNIGGEGAQINQQASAIGGIALSKTMFSRTTANFNTVKLGTVSGNKNKEEFEEKSTKIVFF
jgi:hypothetical protein